MQLNYVIDGIDTDIDITENELKDVIIYNIGLVGNCNKEDAEKFYSIANKLDIDLVDIFNDDIYDYFYDFALEKAKKQEQEDKQEIEELNNMYYKSIKL